VVAAADPYWPSVAARLPQQVVTAAGGSERSGSVRNGLAALEARAASSDWVLVHDAARPCLDSKDLDRLLETVQSHPVGGLLAAPAADTLKRAGSDRAIVETVDRTGLWRALTPQMFRYGRLCDALDRVLASGRLPTDEAQALEWSGEHPMVVEGSTANIKITNADDLAIAEALLGARMRVGVTGGHDT
jgi:2-C-methyl-D-erythritol 4-phosphate cytidylyltransferase